MKHALLLANQYLELPDAATALGSGADTKALVGTLLANMAYFGYAPSLAALEMLRAVDRDALVAFWRTAEPAFKALTGDDRRMDAHVVYKNFPREVLEMSEAEYWFNQVLMYLGAPNEWFAEPAAARPPLDERLKLKMLAPARPSTLSDIYRSLLASKSRWTETQREHAVWLARELQVAEMVLSDFGFKENGIVLIAATLDTEGSVAIDDATDVLRLAAVMSKAEASLREDVKFRSFSRAERRLLLSLLDGSKHLLADMALRPALWKKLMARLHPGDFKFLRVIEAYHCLYQGEYATFNSTVEAKLRAKDATVLADLRSRPGEFARRLHKAYALFGLQAAQAFASVTGQLETSQLLKLRSYLTTINGRAHLIHPPKGNWTKAKFVANEKARFSDEALDVLKTAIDGVLSTRMAKALPQGVDLADETADIKLQTNDQELAPYGRGTAFAIPPQMTFLRSASYWEHKAAGNTWFDNGWLFYGPQWQPMGACCWNHTHDVGDAAVFSGDPTNAHDLKGRACQMIDLYLDKLAARGIRYAVWNVLCYSRVAFADAADVLATLQWGEAAEKGKLYEPARAQMVFPLKGKSLSKYIAYVDVAERRLVYMDANLAGRVDSAASNSAKVAEMMPAFIEYLNSLPSVADLFVHAPRGEVPVLYSDAQRSLEDVRTAYVFKRENADNAFEPLDLQALL